MDREGIVFLMFEMRSKDYALEKVVILCTEYYIAYVYRSMLS